MLCYGFLVCRGPYGPQWGHKTRLRGGVFYFFCAHLNVSIPQKLMRALKNIVSFQRLRARCAITSPKNRVNKKIGAISLFLVYKKYGNTKRQNKSSLRRLLPLLNEKQKRMVVGVYAEQQRHGGVYSTYLS